MRLRNLVAASACGFAALTLAQCGSGSSPTAAPTPVVTVPTPTPTPSSTLGLPPGMICDPTPPPLLRMQLKVHDDSGGASGDRKVLDSKPLVVNVDHYCDRMGFGSWKFCDTRQEGDPQRTACDYLVTGKAEDTGRWGPTWYYVSDLCSDFPDKCANHPDNQFLAVAKASGIYEACAAEGWPVADNGGRCGTIEIK
jgi:hypothetical protein